MTAVAVASAVSAALALPLQSQRELRRIDASIRQLRYLRYCYAMTRDADVLDRRAIRREAARLVGRIEYVFGVPADAPRLASFVPENWAR